MTTNQSSFNDEQMTCAKKEQINKYDIIVGVIRFLKKVRDNRR